MVNGRVIGAEQAMRIVPVTFRLPLHAGTPKAANHGQQTTPNLNKATAKLRCVAKVPLVIQVVPIVYKRSSYRFYIVGILLFKLTVVNTHTTLRTSISHSSETYRHPPSECGSSSRTVCQHNIFPVERPIGAQVHTEHTSADISLPTVAENTPRTIVIEGNVTIEHLATVIKAMDGSHDPTYLAFNGRNLLSTPGVTLRTAGLVNNSEILFIDKIIRELLWVLQFPIPVLTNAIPTECKSNVHNVSVAMDIPFRVGDRVRAAKGMIAGVLGVTQGRVRLGREHGSWFRTNAHLSHYGILAGETIIFTLV